FGLLWRRDWRWSNRFRLRSIYIKEPIILGLVMEDLLDANDIHGGDEIRDGA
ncbi:hypothetical protein TorRG33x02_225900, partial [Trema orientale]